MTASKTSRHEKEIKLHGRSVSRGVAMGKIVCLYGRKRQFFKTQIDDSQIEREVRRFRAAVRLSIRQLKKIAADEESVHAETTAGIIDVHRLILEDASLVTDVENVIAGQRINAEWAVKSVMDGFIAKYKAIEDERLRERYVDLEDVADRMLVALGGGSESPIMLEKNSVIVAREIKPSTLLELSNAAPAALITEHGGWTSHAFILARELNVPAITGVRNALRRLITGDEVIVDGYHAVVIRNPDVETRRKYRSEQVGRSVSQSVAAESSLRTLDGREIVIRANVDFPGVYEEARQTGARGIGLYRSEFLFNQFRGFPPEEEQFEAYRSIADLAGGDGVRIRTFDLSVEQLSTEIDIKEKNPALGLRAIRLSLHYEQQFREQLRALLRAAHGRHIDIVLPMISEVSEIIRTKNLIDEEKAKLKKSGIDFGEISLGSMIEVPGAVFSVNVIAEEIDFICLGTNDLVQYLLAADRDNETVAECFRTLHPAVIQAIKTVVDAGQKRNIPVIACGEMAGSAFYVPILIGLGITEMSMNANSIARIREIVAGIAFGEVTELIQKIATYKTTDEIEAAVCNHIKSHWQHLYPPEILLKN